MEHQDKMYPIPIVPTDPFSTLESVRQVPIRDCIREINDRTWIVAGRILLKFYPTGEKPESPHLCWDDKEKTGCYEVSDAPQPPPDSKPLPEGRFQKILDHDGHVEYEIGEAHLKATMLCCEFTNQAREHATLDWLNPAWERYEFGVDTVPAVIRHDEIHGRHYLFVRRLGVFWQGYQTLEYAWPTMTEETKQHAAEYVAKVAHELAQFTIKGNGKGALGHRDVVIRHSEDGIDADIDNREAVIGPMGIDGGQVIDYDMAPLRRIGPGGATFIPCTSEDLRQACEEMGMDCSTLVFSNNNLSPANIMVHSTNFYTCFIIDWQRAGFVPKEWIRTKCKASQSGWFRDRTWEHQEDYARRLDKALEDLGYPEAEEGYKKWEEKKKEQWRSVDVPCRCRH